MLIAEVTRETTAALLTTCEYSTAMERERIYSNVLFATDLSLGEILVDL
jgi:hypothetical protein